jgi:hypothetical protein
MGRRFQEDLEKDVSVRNRNQAMALSMYAAEYYNMMYNEWPTHYRIMNILIKQSLLVLLRKDITTCE